MWHLKIQVDKQDGVEDNSNLYPDRPGEPDCIYYLRTGFCGYGSRCRFNHPTKRGQVKVFFFYCLQVVFISEVVTDY